MQKTTMTLIAALGLTLAAGVEAGGDPKAGKSKSDDCTGCHGRNGHSSNPKYPNLAGQKEAYLIKATKDYRDGQRQDPMMSSMVKGLSDADIDDLAAFYSSVK